AGEEGGDLLGRQAVFGQVDGDGHGLFAVVPACPAVEVGGGGVGGAVGDEAFLGHVEFAPGLPVGGAQEVGGGVLRGDGDGVAEEVLLVAVRNGVFLALQVPDVFPVGALLQAGGLVAQGGEEGDVLIGDQVRDD